MRLRLWPLCSSCPHNRRVVGVCKTGTVPSMGQQHHGGGVECFPDCRTSIYDARPIRQTFSPRQTVCAAVCVCVCVTHPDTHHGGRGWSQITAAPPTGEALGACSIGVGFWFPSSLNVPPSPGAICGPSSPTVREFPTAIRQSDSRPTVSDSVRQCPTGPTVSDSAGGWCHVR